MYLSKIELTNFRIFKNFKATFDPRVNVIYGSNGQGKTSILEAIYFSVITKSFKTKTDQTVINNEKDFFDIKGYFYNSENILSEQRVYYSKKEGKHAFVNQEKIKNFSYLVGLFPTILLSLEDLDLTYGMPASRRKFLDILLSQLYPSYLFALQKYKKCILQKNKLLSFDDYPQKSEEIEIWNKQLAESGSEILFYRLAFIRFLNKNISTSYNQISKKLEDIKIKYNSTVQDIIELKKGEIEPIFIEALKKNKKNEIKRQTSIIGPHRDDIDFLKDGFPFKSHGSQGENKSFLIALKLLAAKYIFDITAKNPILLLDDIFGELDTFRIENLLKIILNTGQTFITTTDEKKVTSIIKNKSSFLHLEGN